MRFLRAVWLQLIRPLWWHLVWDFAVEVTPTYPFVVGESLISRDHVYQLAKIEGGQAYWERIV